MHRKLVFNKGSYLLTVPKYWVDRNKLGSKEVKIEEEQNQLIIQAEDYKRPAKERSVTLEYSDIGNIRGIMFSLIRLGCDRFTLFFKEKEKDQFLKNIREVVDNYVYGYEIRETKNNCCILANLIPFPSEINTVEKRSFHLVKETFLEVIELLKKDSKNLKSIANLNKSMVQCDSILRSNYSNYPLKNSPFKWQEYRDCYVIQRELFSLVQATINLPKNQKQKILPFMEEFTKMFDQMYLAYFKANNPAELERTGILANEMEKITNQRINKLQGLNPLAMCYLFEVARTIAMFNHSLLQLKMLEEEK
ncbi:MAG: hypothetical protein WCV90_06385 [Candidatus Woesearchaeota archaeon]|jgi:hypothetical protein